jgi:hypothetical protein
MSGLFTFEASGTLWTESTHFGIMRYWIACIGFCTIRAIFSFPRWISVCLIIRLAAVFGWRLWPLGIPFHELIAVILALLIILILGWKN